MNSLKRLNCEGGVKVTGSRTKNQVVVSGIIVVIIIIILTEIRDGSLQPMTITSLISTIVYFFNLCSLCLTEGECVVFGSCFFDESIFIFHEINTHVPLSTLIAHVGKLQNRQLHFEFTSGRSVFYTKK